MLFVEKTVLFRWYSKSLRISCHFHLIRRIHDTHIHVQGIRMNYMLPLFLTLSYYRTHTQHTHRKAADDQKLTEKKKEVYTQTDR